MKILDHNAVLSHLPNRKPDSHKGDYGRILLLCGSRGYTGAAALAAMGALRSGAWLHGAAGDICAEKIGQYGMLPSDLLEVLPRLMK